MYSSFPQFVLGFHGCDRKVGEAIIAGQSSLFASKNLYDWLGSGIYFWENAPARAMQWANDCANNPLKTQGAIEEPFVLGAIIDLGNCLNLTDVGYWNLLKESYELLSATFEKAELSLPANTKKLKKLDCMVINNAIQNNKDIGQPDFDTVRGAFIEGEPVYPGATLFAQTHIQVCVRNPNCIKGYFKPMSPSTKFNIP